MNKLYDIAIRYGAAISFVLVMLLLALFSGVSVAGQNDGQLPEGMTVTQVPFGLACAEPTRMRDILLEDHGEIALFAGWLDSGAQWLLYVNEANTSMTWVVHKDDQACIVWSGYSSEGQAVVPNPEPQWPAMETKAPEWNL